MYIKVGSPCEKKDKLVRIDLGSVNHTKMLSLGKDTC